MTPALRLLLGTIVPVVVLDALLVFGNAWPTLWPQPAFAVSVELAFAVGALALVAAWRGRVPHAVVHALAGLATLWIVLRYVQVTVPAMLGRPLNLYWDLPHLGAVLGMGGDGPAGKAVLAMLLAVLVLIVLQRIVKACVVALARSAAAPVTRRALAGAAGAAILAWALPPWNGTPWEPPSPSRWHHCSSIRSVSCARRSAPAPPTASASVRISMAISRPCAEPTS